ncbi:MAG: hypothetical protein HGA39_07675 [Coriobacteriia bacterium]|nr:hypothetical protein [Coriobacteriia bacterium]
MDTSDWERRTFDVRSGVRLDPRNVRLEETTAKVEADIMEDLFANEEALRLVEGICTVGYLTHEVPVVVKRDGEIVVVEGNRRVAALKAIQNPMLVPDYSNRIGSILKRNPGHPKIASIEALVAPSQDAADQLIAALHTGNLRRPWTPSRQAAFFQAQIDGGRTYEELVERYPMSDVRKFVFRAQLVNRLKSAHFEDPALQDFVASPRFKKGLSTLSRIHDSKEFRELMGLQIRDDGSFTTSVAEDQFDAIAAVVISGIKEGSLNTRTLNKVKDNPRFSQLMRDLHAAIGSSGAEEGKSPGSSGIPGGEGPSNVNAPPPSKPPTTAKPPRKALVHWLDVVRVKVPPSYGEGFKQCLEELSTTDVQQRPATAFLLMRAALEKGIKSYAEAQSVDIRPSHNQQGYVYLSHCLEWLSDTAKANGDRWVVQVVSNMDKLVYYAVSKDKLNAVNHNHKLYVTPDEAVEMWRSVVSLLEYVVQQ